MKKIILQKGLTLKASHLKFNSSFLVHGIFNNLSGLSFDISLNELVSQLSAKEMIIDVKYEYLSSRIVKNLLELFKKIDKNPNIHIVTINWFYDLDDEEYLETGEILSGLTKKCKFRFHPVWEGIAV